MSKLIRAYTAVWNQVICHGSSEGPLSCTGNSLVADSWEKYYYIAAKVELYKGAVDVLVTKKWKIMMQWRLVVAQI